MNRMALRLPAVRAALIIALAWAAAGVGETPNALDWPEPYIAPHVHLSSVGDHLNINGMPAQIYRYTTSSKPEEVVRYFQDHVERDFTRAAASKALPGQAAVAGRVGDFWVTLQFQQQAGETVGTWSAIPQFMPDVREPVQRPAGFPASAELIQQVDSFDDDKRSELAIGTDPGPIDGVALRLESELREQGFAKQATPQATWPAPDVYVAVFRKDREELLVTLKRQPGGTTVMINRISALEEFK